MGLGAASHCIELRFPTGRVDSFSVTSYLDALGAPRRLSDSGLMFQGLTWTKAAPPPEQLSEQWTAAGRWEFRISDRPAYDRQMLHRLGID